MHLKGMRCIQLPDFYLNHVVGAQRLKWRERIQTVGVV